MHACRLMPLNEGMNSSLGITGLCPKGVPVQEALSTLDIYFTSILLREGGNWDVSFLVVQDQNVNVQSVFRQLAVREWKILKY